MTRRDERMLEWFAIVRLASVQTVRWVLGALNGWDRPVSVRQAQSWCARMRAVGMVDQAQLGVAGGSVVWATAAAIGRARPDLLRQNTRHELAVAAVSARYAAAGYGWLRDDRPAMTGGHQADGVAIGLEWVEFVEVELTGKRPARYASIFETYRLRLERGEALQLTYVASAGGARAVRAALREQPVGRAIADRVVLVEVFDRSGLWAEERLPSWLTPAGVRAEALVGIEAERR